MSTLSPNMNLVLSTVGIDTGLAWETNLNLSLNTIDQHNHTPGNGVQVPTSGLNINSNLSFNTYQATNIGAVVFNDQGSLSTLNALYTLNGELWFNDVTAPVQLTLGGAVNATSSGISSGTATASFSSGVLVVNANSLTPANIQGASILIGNNTASSNFVTLSPVNALATNYPLILPTLPGVRSFLSLDSSGNIAAFTPTAAGITAAMIANNTITTSQISNTANITGSQLASGTITSGNIANQTITATQIANNTITATQVANGTLTSTQIQAGSITPASQVASVSGTHTISSSTGITTSATAAITLSLTSGRAVIITLSTVNAQGVSGDVVSSGSNNVSIFKNGVALATIYQATAATNHPAINFSFIDTAGGSSANTYDLRTNAGTFGPNAGASISMVFSVVQL